MRSSTFVPSVFITGAAAGIGRATALRFAREGWCVGVADVDTPGLAELVQCLQAQPGAEPGRVWSCRLDVTDVQAWQLALDAFCTHTQGRLDLLFNNAGISATAPFEETSVSRHLAVIDVNVKGVVLGCHAAHRHLRQTPGSRVINMCSASALHGQPMLSSYSATKAAVRSLTEALDIEWRAQGIRVFDVLPLFVDTAMVRDDVARMQTVRTLGVRLSADDVADRVWRLASSPQSATTVHVTVGWQTTLFAWAARLSPGFVNRWVTARLAGY
jgi:NAD(P)-dependent dehydrogenase (short-subunit alcohol dehydrogenase family)